MLPKNLQIKKDFESGKIKHQGYHNLLIALGLLVFCLIAVGINYVIFNYTTITTNLGLWWFMWGLVGAFVSQRINEKVGTSSDMFWSFPLYVSAIIVAYPMDFIYKRVNK